MSTMAPEPRGPWEAIEAIEGHCRRMRRNLHAGHVALVEADARSIIGNAVDLVVTAALDGAADQAAGFGAVPKTGTPLLAPGVPILGSTDAFAIAIAVGRKRIEAGAESTRGGHDRALLLHRVKTNRHSDGTALAGPFAPSPGLEALMEAGQVSIRSGSLSINNCARNAGESPSACPMCAGMCPLGNQPVQSVPPYYTDDEDIPF